MQVGNIRLKDSSRNALKERNYFELQISLMFTCYCSDQPRSSMVQLVHGSIRYNHILDHNSWFSYIMTLDNALRKVAFAGMAFNTNAAMMVPQIKTGFVRLNNLLPICMAVCIIISHCSCMRRCFAEGDPLQNRFFYADQEGTEINKLTMQTMIHLQQLTSVFPIVYMKLYLPSAPCGPCVYHRALTSPFGVHFQISELSDPHRSIASKLSSRWCCYTAIPRQENPSSGRPMILPHTNPLVLEMPSFFILLFTNKGACLSLIFTS